MNNDPTPSPTPAKPKPGPTPSSGLHDPATDSIKKLAGGGKENPPKVTKKDSGSGQHDPATDAGE